MKLLLFTFLSIFFIFQSFGQAPNQLNYQGVLRNSVGNVLPNKAITVRLTIRDLTATGTSVYSETRAITTNSFGLYNIVVGSGGATSVTGAIASINWGIGAKFMQVEIDPEGGSTFVNIGSSQLQSVPFAVLAGNAPPIGPAGGDLLGSTYPNPIIASLAVGTSKLADAAITTIKITDQAITTNKLADGSVTTIKLADLAITTNKLADAAVSTIKIADGAVTSQKITVPLIKTLSDPLPLLDFTNSGAGHGISGTNTGTGFGGLFQVNNPASTADGLRATTNGIGASWAIRGISTGTNGAGLFQQTNATNTSNNLQSNQAGLGRAGLFNSTNALSAANAVDVNVAGTGFALRAASTNAAPKALLTVGGLQLTGIGEAANRILTSDASGNATWQSVAAGGAVTGSGTLSFLPKWTPSGNILGNSLLFDDGINIGIGTVAPTHKLTVDHGGSTGISVNSSASFSVVDINAASGDAALRFQKAGVNQWNTRNRPADDYYEIFELGGGGSRFVIQDGTGNVGIGETASPTYKLDVLHGGSTGIRSRSSASFSVVDIDAQSGDAALRFAKAGVNQWNMRNRPADDYFEIFELGGGGSRLAIQDGTGNVGIGNTSSSIAYKLDVEHNGSTGIRNKSTSSFSIIDIDAASGDAALRFAKAGVNQWNTRNRPGDDYYEIFELGGGGSRFVIQDGTGNVGIGETTAPTYKLDVLHGGSNGIRSRSSASFSVVDIDGQSGDAALRFVKAGVNQWNTRNNPGTDDYQIFELGGGGERMRIDNTTGKVWVNGDFTVVGAKAFTMDHPLDPENKTLMHAAAESNEVINFYSGNITTDVSGKAMVTLPSYFEAINKDFRYQLTVVGGTFAQAIISKEVANNKFEIATNQPNIKVSWEVKGVRNDARMRKFPFISEADKTAQQQGRYIDPAAYNQPESKRVSYSNVAGSSLEDVKPQAVKVANTLNTQGGSLSDAPTPKTNKAQPENEKESSLTQMLAPKLKAAVINNEPSSTNEVATEKKAALKPKAKPIANNVVPKQ